VPGVNELQGTKEERRLGTARNGTVGIYEFDQGVYLTLGAELHDDPNIGGQKYFLTGIPGVCPPPGYPGIPIVFAAPDDRLEEYRMPLVMVRRDDIQPALQRWAPGSKQYRTAAPGAQRRRYEVFGETYSEGWSEYEDVAVADPFDISYSLTVTARNRGGRLRSAPRNQAGAILHHVLKTFRPHSYSYFKVVDSVGDTRYYNVFLESIGPQDEFGEPTERVIAHSVSIRVEAVLDLEDPVRHNAVTSIRSSFDTT